jgi:hypothetical protein
MFCKGYELNDSNSQKMKTLCKDKIGLYSIWIMGVMCSLVLASFLCLTTAQAQAGTQQKGQDTSKKNVQQSTNEVQKYFQIITQIV